MQPAGRPSPAPAIVYVCQFHTNPTASRQTHWSVSCTCELHKQIERHKHASQCDGLLSLEVICLVYLSFTEKASRGFVGAIRAVIVKCVGRREGVQWVHRERAVRGHGAVCVCVWCVCVVCVWCVCVVCVWCVCGVCVVCVWCVCGVCGVYVCHTSLARGLMSE